VPDPIPDDPAALDAIRRSVLENPLAVGNLLSADGRTTALVVSFLISDREFVEKRIDEQIAAIAHQEAQAPGVEVWLAGGPHVRVSQIRAQLADLRRSIPLILGVLAAVLVVAFRTTRGVVLPLAAVLISVLWTLATAVALGREFNIVTSLVPPLLIILGLSYSVHVVAGYYEALRLEPDRPNADAVERTLAHMWLAVALTGLTTAAGFLAMLLSPMRAVAETGWLSVIGVIYTMIVSLVLVPAALSALGPPRRGRARLESARDDAFARFAERAGEFAVSHRRAILISAGAISAAAITAAVTRLDVGTNTLDAFPEDSVIRRDFDAVNRELGGANQFNVIVEAERDGQLLDPANLREIDRLQRWLTELPEIGGATSVVDYQRLLNRALHGGAPEAATIPTDRRLAAQLAAFAGEDLERYLDVTRRRANLTVRANVMDTSAVSDLIRRIETRLRELPEGLEGRVTGNAVLLNRVVEDMLRGQAQSVLGALVLIYALMRILFLDFRTAFWALIPNALPIAVYFGALGFSGVSLNPSTSLIAPMALGIAIDDTIHYFARFSDDARRLADERRATIAALRAVGRPVTYTGASICLGFLMMTTSELSNFVEVGALASFTLAFGWLCEFTLTPALCSGLRVVTLWDTLTYDLGEDPQHSIPLFRGLTQAQCRIVALMAGVRRVPAGQALMKAGELGRELYVVIDGKLRAWVQGDRGPIELNVMSRGAPIGEVGLFEQPRSANIDVLEDARVLRITQSDLLRLRRRYPKIASILLWNLNEVFAQRLLSTTAKLH
jgi:predicted RND superfamily exporter protein